MTDVAVDPGAWVPRLGDSTIPEGHAELIRGLYRLAAWVADHPEIPAPRVGAEIPAPSGSSAAIDGFAEALGVATRVQGRHPYTLYTARAEFGPVRVYSFTASDALVSANAVEPPRAEGWFRRTIRAAVTVAGGVR